MNIELPAAIAGYFAADQARDAEALARQFVDDGVARDEGKTHEGRDQIRAWMAEAWTKYACITEPFAVATAGGRTVVTTHVRGDFPGSPLDLRYFFVLDGDRIAELEIKP